jgi:hypothetical protein
MRDFDEVEPNLAEMPDGTETAEGASPCPPRRARDATAVASAGL